MIFDANFLNNLEKKLKRKLPGFEAQAKMAPASRISNDYEPNPDGARQSSVILLLIPVDNRVNLVIIRRVYNDSIHSGQLAFPGGKVETHDQTIFDTAIRECTEEIGVLPSEIRIIGQLTSIYIPVSNYTVHPVVGCINYQPTYIPNVEEVEEIHEVELQQLCKPENRILKKLMIRDLEREVPVFEIGNLEIWGATAMILSEFIEIIEN